MRVSIVGADGCGRTVFLGLLYETLVQMTTANGNDDRAEMRFICDPQTAKCLGDVRLDLLSGKWPSAGRRRSVSDCSLEVGLRRKGLLGLHRSNSFMTLTVRSYDICKRDFKAIEGTTLDGDCPDPDSLSEEIREAFDATLVVILLDAGGSIVNGASSVMSTDAFHASLLRSILRSRRSKGYPCSMPFPVIFLTKFDLTGSEISDKGSYEKMRDSILMKHFPLTFKEIEDDRSKRAIGEVFVSGLRTVDEEGEIIPHPLSDRSAVRIGYSSGEYESFIRMVNRVARRNCDR